MRSSIGGCVANKEVKACGAPACAMQAAATTLLPSNASTRLSVEIFSKADASAKGFLVI